LLSALRTDPYVRLSRIRLVWGFLRQGASPFLSPFVHRFFCSIRAASILPSRPHISITVARSGDQGQFSDADVARVMIRGEPAIGRDQSREPRLYSVEPRMGSRP
jgi:hypothetical protein